MTYSEKLQDPRWQKKRLAVLERAGWKCECCGDDKEILKVHHLIYSKGEPWDAPMENLECLCWTCHQWREQFNQRYGGRSLVATKLCQRFDGWYEKIFNEKAIGVESCSTVFGLFPNHRSEKTTNLIRK